MRSCSVVIPSFNPDARKLERVLDALRLQTLDLDEWELIVVDNASAPPLADRIDISWHPAARCVVEHRVGSLNARVRGGTEADSPLLIFVDDDNILRKDYLQQAILIAEQHPTLGVWSGQSHPEFESPPPEWAGSSLAMLAVWEFEEDEVCEDWNPSFRLPVSAGMCARREVMQSYVGSCMESPLRALLGRQGRSLMGSEDEDFALHAFAQGWAVGHFSRLHLTHLISSGRLRRDYLLELTAGMGASGVVLQRLYPQFVYSRPSRIPYFLRVLRHSLRRPGWERDRRLAYLRGERYGESKVRQILRAAH